MPFEHLPLTAVSPPMKKLLIVLFAALAVNLSAAAAGPTWLTDLPKAQAQAKAQEEAQRKKAKSEAEAAASAETKKREILVRYPRAGNDAVPTPGAGVLSTKP